MTEGARGFAGEAVGFYFVGADRAHLHHPLRDHALTVHVDQTHRSMLLYGNLQFFATRSRHSASPPNVVEIVLLDLVYTNTRSLCYTFFEHLFLFFSTLVLERQTADPKRGDRPRETYIPPVLEEITHILQQLPYRHERSDDNRNEREHES